METLAGRQNIQEALQKETQDVTKRLSYECARLRDCCKENGEFLYQLYVMPVGSAELEPKYFLLLKEELQKNLMPVHRTQIQRVLCPVLDKMSDIREDISSGRACILSKLDHLPGGEELEKLISCGLVATSHKKRFFEK